MQYDEHVDVLLIVGHLVGWWSDLNKPLVYCMYVKLVHIQLLNSECITYRSSPGTTLALIVRIIHANISQLSREQKEESLSGPPMLNISTRRSSVHTSISDYFVNKTTTKEIRIISPDEQSLARAIVT